MGDIRAEVKKYKMSQETLVAERKNSKNTGDVSKRYSHLLEGVLTGYLGTL